MQQRSPTLDELRDMVAKVDPTLVAAEQDIDRSLIQIALARRPLERVEFAQQMLATLMTFNRGGTPRL